MTRGFIAAIPLELVDDVAPMDATDVPHGDLPESSAPNIL